MKRGVLMAVLVAGTVLASAPPSHAQFQRYDTMWARSTNGAALTLDGVLDEAEWAQAESVLVRYPFDNGLPGSGWKDEGGFPATDRTYAVFKFLTVGDQLWMAATVRDSSIGGSKDFNRFDGLLMSIKNHANGSRPASPGEHLLSWWSPDTSDHNPTAVDHLPTMIGVWRHWPPGTPATPTQLQAWETKVAVHGHTNDDSQPDTSWVVEMRCDMPLNGYDITRAQGDIIEWNCSVYDIDWYWPLANFFRFAVNRSWIQGPWGNDAWYHNVKLHARPDVTVASGPVPANTPDLVIPNLGVYAAPTVDGSLGEAVWGYAPSFDIRYDDTVLRDAYPATGPWRSGQYQAPVNGNGGNAYVADPADATVKYFFKGTKLYLGFDVRDQVVQSAAAAVDRWDGFILSINDRTARFADNNLKSHRISFRVGPTGSIKTEDELTNLRDTLGVAQAQLVLKAPTTLDTLGLDVDAGYTAEFAIDLTALGYAPDLGDHTLYFGIDLLDGDSYSPFTDSYGTRTWFFRQYENQDGPCVAFLDPNTYVTAGVGDGGAPRLALGGNFPNPFKRGTTIRYSLPSPSLVDLEVFDLQGRVVVSRVLGLQAAGSREVLVPRFAARSGVYLYRLRVRDGVTGTDRGTLSGKMMVLQ